MHPDDLESHPKWLSFFVFLVLAEIASKNFEKKLDRGYCTSSQV
jgi:hypothetical protein